MKDFALKHPLLTTFFIVPTVVWATVTLVRGHAPAPKTAGPR